MSLCTWDGTGGGSTLGWDGGLITREDKRRKIKTTKLEHHHGNGLKGTASNLNLQFKFQKMLDFFDNFSEASKGMLNNNQFIEGS